MCRQVENNSCRVCRKTVRTRENSAEKILEELHFVWDYEKNNEQPKNIHNFSKKFFFICQKEHSFQTTITSARKNINACPYCANKKVLAGYNDLETRNPILAKQLVNQDPTKVLYNRTVNDSQWKCEYCNKIYIKSIKKRHTRSDCPYCCNKQYTVKGVNDFLTLYSGENKISVENNFEKLSKMSRYSKSKILWECEKRHVFKASPYRVLREKYSCPYCRGTKLLSGYNDAETKNPELMKEWSQKNKEKLSNLLPSHSTKPFLWECPECSYEYKSTVSNKIRRNLSCVKCRKSKSLLQEEIQKFVVDLGFEIVIDDRKIIAPWELDIVIPNIKSAIEVNGEYWHSDKMIQKRVGMSADEYHNMKKDKSISSGYRILFVEESDWNEDNRRVKAMILGFLENDISSIG